MSTVAAVAQYERAFSAVSRSFGGSARLRERREQALRRFLSAGFPSTREENWKYTDLRPIMRREFEPAASLRGQIPAEQLAGVAFAELPTYRLVFVNGWLAPEHSLLPDDHDTLLVGGLADQLGRQPELLDELPELDHDDRFASLNTAFLNDGAMIRVPSGLVVDRPVYLMFVSLPQQAAVIAHPRIQIDIGANATATVIEHHIGLGKSTNFTNLITDISCQAGARLEHYRVQEESVHGFHVAGLHARQERDSRLVSHNIALGGKLCRCDLATRLIGPGAEVELNGFYMASDRQHLDNHTRIDHLAPHTKSREDYRGVVAGHGRAVFNGKVVVHEGAQRTDARQFNKNLLLSPTAEVDTKPELEIYADDVMCSHGATVGELDKDALFYLLSRGIDERTARGLLTFAFADDVIARVSLEPIRRRLERNILDRLPDSERLQEFV